VQGVGQDFVHLCRQMRSLRIVCLYRGQAFPQVGSGSDQRRPFEILLDERTDFMSSGRGDGVQTVQDSLLQRIARRSHGLRGNRCHGDQYGRGKQQHQFQADREPDRSAVILGHLHTPGQAGPPVGVQEPGAFSIPAGIGDDQQSWLCAVSDFKRPVRYEYKDV
jgi:hypothetical protein